MSIEVPYLSPEEIERSAELLLLEYKVARGMHRVLPIPVEGFLERHFGLTLDFDDLHAKLDVPMSSGQPEILGALWVETGEVFIDQSLDPEENPELETRYRFTLAHEIGHWRLHKDLLMARHFNSRADREAPAVCRAGGVKKDRIEWQENYFASCLLMPRRVVDVCWREKFSRSIPLAFEVFEGRSDWTKPPIGWTENFPLPLRLTNRFNLVRSRTSFTRLVRFWRQCSEFRWTRCLLGCVF